MEMPKEPDEWIEIAIFGDGKVIQTGESWRNIKNGKCYYATTTPENFFNAVPVPPHYDLIDHNALKIAVMDCDAETRIDFLKHAMDCINKAPVVIPSDMPTYEKEDGE
jgi:hypothetical protein